MSLTVVVSMPAEDRAELSRWTRTPSLPAGLAQRARIVLLADEGVGTNEIVHRVGVSKPTVIAWKKRYAADGIAGLDDRPKPGRPAQVDEVAVVLATLEPPPERLGVTHWSSSRCRASSRSVRSSDPARPAIPARRAAAAFKSELAWAPPRNLHLTPPRR